MKRLLLLFAILLIALPVMAQDDMDPCDLDPPEMAAEVNFIGVAFPLIEFMAEELEKCNSVDNLTVNAQVLDSASSTEQVNLALAGGGDSPWALLHTDLSRIGELNEFDALHPITDLVEKYWDEYDLGDIPQTAWDAVTLDGDIYGVPFMQNTFHIFYRSDLFEKWELEAPATYDDVIDACEVLKQEPSIDLPFTMNLHAGWAWEIEFMHFLRAFGGYHLNDDNTPGFNSAEGVAALNKMKEVVDACMGQEGLTYSIDDSEIGMETGTLAFINIWASRAANMDNPDKSNYVGIINFSPAPMPNPDTGILGGSAWIDALSLTKRSGVDHDLVFRVVMETVDKASQAEGALHGPILRSSVIEEGGGGRYFQAMGTSVAEGVGSYSIRPAASLFRTILSNWLPLVGSGELTAEEALQNAADEYTAEATTQGFIEG